MEHFRLIKTYLSLAPRPGSSKVALIAALLLGIIFLLSEFNLTTSLEQSWSASGIQVFEKREFYRLWTATLIHANAEHLLGNLWAFTGLSFLLFGYFGWLVFPVLTLFLGGVVNLFTLATYPPEVSLVGASGMVYFMAGFWLTLYVAIDRRTSILRRIVSGIGFVLVLLVPSTAQLHVSYRAHAIGLGIGLLTGVGYFLWRKKALRQFEYYEPDDEDTQLSLVG